MPTHSLAAVLVFAVLVSFGAVISPGPVSAAIVTEAPRHGWRVGPLVASGHSLLELIITVLIGVGLSTALVSTSIQNLISLGGGLVLLYIGSSYLRAARTNRLRMPEPEENAKPRSQLALVSLGILTTISNPFWYAWWMTVAAGYLAQARSLGIAGVGVFYLGHISTDFAWDTFLASASQAGGRLLSDTGYRMLILVTGGFMVYFGGVFLWNGLRALGGW